MKKLSLIAMAAGLLVGCNRTTDLTLNMTGLEDLGSEYAYEGWIIVNGEPITTGVFNVDGSGKLSETTFELDKKELEDATAFVLTIEPANDPDPAPSKVHILAGDFSGDNASLTVSHASAIGDDFTGAEGSFILATPTDADDMNEEAGIWWLNDGNPGLTLPELPDGWRYEGWAVIDGTPVSTGTFSTASGADNDDSFSGTLPGPPFPGEDFLMNAPSGLDFPADLRGATAVISVEPHPDNSAAPFTLKPLASEIDNGAETHSPISMNNNAKATNPTGSVTR